MRVLGAYVLLQFSWWAYLLASTVGARERWMVLGEGSVFAALLVLGVMRLERNFRQERLRLARERNLLLGVTHELKTPLASVQLGVDSLRRLKLSEEDRTAVLENMQNGGKIWVTAGGCCSPRGSNAKPPCKRPPSIGATCLTRPWGASGVQRDRIRLHRIEGSQEVRGDRALWVLSASNLIENA